MNFVKSKDFSKFPYKISVGDGISGNAGVSFSSGMFTRNPREIESSFLQGHSVGLSGGLGLGIDASISGSYAPLLM